MGHHARISQLGDGPKDQGVVQLLRFVDSVAARNPAGMEVSNQREAGLDISNDVSVHDLDMVDVEKNFDPR